MEAEETTVQDDTSNQTAPPPEPGTQTVEPKLVSKFSWDLVDVRVIKEMLVQAAADRGEQISTSKFGSLDDQQLRSFASKTLGRPPRANLFTREMTRVLISSWVPLADDEILDELTHLVQLRLSGPAANEALNSRRGMSRFLSQRKVTQNTIANVRSAFLKAHKVPSPVHGTNGGASGPARGHMRLVGRGERPTRDEYPHHALVRRKLDELSGQGKRLQGRMVLPTGAGKTDALGSWILRRMEADPDLRVLWISHQQELLSQAIMRLHGLARSLPEGFERKAREIHGAGSAKTTLAEADLHVAAITFPSLASALSLPTKPVDRFLAKPTLVVVDEAHHAGAPAYSSVLKHLLHQPSVQGLIGLTATPYPTSALANWEFANLFPTEVFKLEPVELVQQQILAIPVLHTVYTGVAPTMTSHDRSAAISNDYRPATLAELASCGRDNLIVEAWETSKATWGKTLVFATGIDHADTLAAEFEARGHHARALHSRSIEPRASILRWFKDAAEPCVLISVGMLTEGVDLPDARTAFLARPTTSRILMQQMIGRVLRGPKASGTPVANLVYFQDEWQNFEDNIEPGSIVATCPTPRLQASPELPPTMAELLGRFLEQLEPVEDDEGNEVSIEVAKEVQTAWGRAAEELTGEDAGRVEPLLRATTLAGYYQLPDRAVPVFEHQLDAFHRFVEHVTRYKLPSAAIDFFRDLEPPYPTARTLKDLQRYVQQNRGAPPFVPLQATLGPELTADRLLQAGAITDDERAQLIADAYRSSIARYAYRSLWHFEEAVDAELRERRRRKHDDSAGLAPETIEPQTVEGLPKLPRMQRSLGPAVALALRTAQRILPPEHAHRLDDPPPVDWTRHPQSSTWAHWSYRRTKTGTFKQEIWINRILSTKRTIVSDQLLAYLVYHELLHHLLPGQGHDDEFRALEALWPDAAVHDAAFDTIHERWNTKASDYR
jgi:superfamily II DNA or RNA helicase